MPAQLRWQHEKTNSKKELAQLPMNSCLNQDNIGIADFALQDLPIPPPQTDLHSDILLSCTHRGKHSMDWMGEANRKEDATHRNTVTAEWTAQWRPSWTCFTLPQSTQLKEQTRTHNLPTCTRAFHLGRAGFAGEQGSWWICSRHFANGMGCSQCSLHLGFFKVG